MYLLLGRFNEMFTAYFETHQIEYYIINDVKSQSSRGISIDFSDKKALYAAVDTLPVKPTCVLTMYEQYIPVTADVNVHLGLTHALSPTAARLSTDKVLMRQAFATANEPISPAFTLVETTEQVTVFAEQHGFPLILKPANLSKSLLITRCDSMPELLAAWEQTVREAPALYAQFTDGLRPRFILEQFMPGSVHTVLGFADKDGNVALADGIVDNVTAKEIGFDDSFIFSRTIPSQLSAVDQKALLHCAKLGIETLGLRSCAAHVELVLTAEGPRLIEIGARIGGYRTAMYEKASGIDVINATLQAYDGTLPDLTAHKQAFYRAIEIFPEQKGKCTRAENFETAAKLPSILSARFKCVPGETIGKAAEGFKAAIVIELASDSEAQIVKDYEYICKNVRVLVK
jgi:hypothetical protein